MKGSKIIIIILIVVAFGAGVYFKADAIRFYSNLNKKIQDFQKTEVGQTLTRAGKEILAPPPLKAGASGEQATLLQTKIVAETNLQRAQNGNLPALKGNTKLDEAAAAKANDMFLNQYFEHTSPGGIDPGKLVQNCGYDYIVAGENLILGNFSSEKEVVQDWMDSPGHRANILNSRYSEIGVAVIKGNYKGESVWIGVQEFGLPLAACVSPNSSLKDGIDLEKTQLDTLTSEIDAKKNQISDTDSNSAPYDQMINDYNKMVAQYNSFAEQTKEDIAKYNNQVSNFNDCVKGQ